MWNLSWSHSCYWPCLMSFHYTWQRVVQYLAISNRWQYSAFCKSTIIGCDDIQNHKISSKHQYKSKVWNILIYLIQWQSVFKIYLFYTWNLVHACLFGNVLVSLQLHHNSKSFEVKHNTHVCHQVDKLGNKLLNGLQQTLLWRQSTHSLQTCI